MAKSAASRGSTSPASVRETVNFRADASFIKMLDEGAARHGLKSGDVYARLLVERALTNSEAAELRHELTQLREEVRRGREDVATLALAVLVKSGEELQDAKNWVAEHFLKK